MKQSKACSWVMHTLIIGLMGTIPCLSAEMDYWQGHSQLSAHMESQYLASNPGKNTVVCPIGPEQILADLCQVADENAVKEIVSFTKTSFEGAAYGAFVKAIPENTPFPSKEEKNEEDQWSYHSKELKNAFYNGHLILPSTAYELNLEKVEQLNQLKAQIIPCDYSNPKEAADHVNDLISTHTNKLIPSIVGENDFSQDPVALILASTLYINNSWKDKFDKRYIDFHGTGKTKTVKGFGATLKLPYHQTDKETTVLIPATGKTSLLIRMNHDSTPTAITHDDAASFFKNQTKGERIEFSMPAFTIENTLDLQELLNSVMPKLMNKEPFTIDLFKEKKEVYIGKFVQKNKLDVTKDGLEGASATVMMLMTKSLHRTPRADKVICIDRPFSFSIIKMVDKNHWLTLFTGQIFEPIAPKKAK